MKLFFSSPIIAFLASNALLFVDGKRRGIFGDDVTAEVGEDADNHCHASNFVMPDIQGPIPIPHLSGLIGGFLAMTEGIRQYETPYALRFTKLIDQMDWNCAAIYSESWLDAFHGGEVLLRTPRKVTIDATEIDLHNSDSRFLCIANAWATVIQDWVPEASTPLLSTLGQFAIPGLQPGFKSQVDSCFDSEGDDISADIACLEDISSQSCYSPTIMGAIAARQATEYAKRDGWNMYGQLNSDGTKCNSNCRRYTDPTKYNPVNVPGLSVGEYKRFKERWQPLLEDNGRGYFTRQEHVAPHIGILGKTAALAPAEFLEKVENMQDPKYNYNDEAWKVIERMSTLDDKKKMLIEFFDDKFNVFFAVIEAVLGGILTVGVDNIFEHTLNYSLGATSGDYDAILLAWRAKVDTDLVRPTTWIRNELSEETFNTWGGPFQGMADVQGKNFDAFKRVMPHSEYVSGSGCLCTALYQYTDAWVDEFLGMDTVSVSVDFPKYSSKVEPGMTPADDLMEVFASMEDMRDACGESRLDGGMHFSKSVPASYELCDGVGAAAFAHAKSLWGA